MNKKTNDAAIANERAHAGREITTRGGLLIRDDQVIPLPEADSVAIAHGFHCAEAMVRSLERPRASDRANKRNRAKRRYR